MTASIMNTVFAWLLTYAIHSTILLTMAWIVSRRVNVSPVMRDVIWKTALVGGVITSLAQQSLSTPFARDITLDRVEVEATLIPSANTSSNTAKSEAPNAPTNTTIERATRDAEPAETPSVAPATQTETVSNINWISVVVIAWAILAVLLSVAYVARRLVLIGRLANRRAVAEGPLPSMLDSLCRAVKHRSRVRLTWVNTIASPVALGSSEICLPEAALTDLGPDEQRSLLAHELAHLTRRDPLWLAAIAIIERVFFFQPLNRVARASLQRNAEFLCDDWAASQSGSGLPLAHCLERVAEWMEATPLGVPVAGMAEQRSLLVTRIARLIEGRRATPVASRFAIAVGTLSVLAVTAAAAPGVRAPGARLPSSANPNSSVDSTQGATLQSAQNAPDPIATSKVAQRAVQSAVSGEIAERDESKPHAGVDTRASSAPVAEQDTAVVSALIERLKDSDASVRRAAAAALGNLKSRRAVNALIAAAGDRNRDVRHAVIEALAELEDPAAISTLTKALSDEFVEVRSQALEGLGAFKDELRASSFVPLLKDANASVRTKAIERLRDIGDRSLIDELSPSLRDADAEVRRAVLEALKEFGDRSASSSIVPLLRDGDADVRSAALETLSELKAVVNERDLQGLLTDQSPDVRSHALEYLQENPVPQMISSIVKLVEDANSDVRQQAVETLSRYRDPAARAALRSALKSDDPKVRRRAAEALGDRQ